MNPSNGLVTALNAMREMSVKNGGVYHQYVPVITDLTSIGEFGTPILEIQDVRNEFMTTLIRRIVETQIEGKVFNNKLEQLEGEEVPLGYSIQDLYVNPAKGRKFDVEDFAGLLQKYEADVKQQFLTVNMDLQYPVTITRAKLKNAFVSWASLEAFITGITNSLFSGANIDQYNSKHLLPVLRTLCSPVLTLISTTTPSTSFPMPSVMVTLSTKLSLPQPTLTRQKHLSRKLVLWLSTLLKLPAITTLGLR